MIAQTPGLSYGTPTAEGNNASLTLRGVGLSDFNDNNEGPVAVYVDEVYVSALSDVTFQLFDLERVEVLHWVTGLYYYDQETDGGFQIDASGIGFIIGDANYTQETESWSVFGQIEYDFADAWTVLAGLR